VSTTSSVYHSNTKYIVAVNVLRNDPARWEQEVRSLKSLRSNLSIERKLFDEKVAAQEDFRKYLQWIKKDDDPEQTLGEIEEYVNPQRYEQYAEWFLSSAAFVAWSEAFQDLEHCGTSKRALWISGPYGTGKTTIV
jgi:predicted NACHT family NTPase